MKIRFVAAQTYMLNPKEEYADVYAEFEVAEAPTEEQIDAIQMDINDSYDEWYEDVLNQDAAYSDLCRELCLKHGVKIVDNPIAHTFYI